MSATRFPLRGLGVRAAPMRRVLCSSPPTPAVASPPATPSWDCVKFEDVVRAHHRIKSGIVRTPCVKSHWMSLATGCEIFLKSEQLQFTGSFKERGARNALLSLTPEKKAVGVIAASAGNHALALAWHGSQLGIPVTVVMPTVAPMAKVEKCRSFGVNVVIHGAHIGEAKEYAQSYPDFDGLTYINGYDDPEVGSPEPLARDTTHYAGKLGVCHSWITRTSKRDYTLRDKTDSTQNSGRGRRHDLTVSQFSDHRRRGHPRYGND